MATLAGKFLVARPVLRDPNFVQSVVLILQHGSQGALGLVVNRPRKVIGVPFEVFVGGPCGEQQGLILLHGHREWLENADDMSGKEVIPGVYLGDSECLQRVSKAVSASTFRYRVFTGYAGWGPDQLESELATGAWAITPANDELLFDTEPSDLWNSVVPPSLPQPSLN